MNDMKIKKWKIIFLVLVILICIIVMAGMIVFKHYYNLLDVQIDKADNDNAASSEEIEIAEESNLFKETEIVEESNLFESMNIGEDVFNIMLLGIDSRDKDFTGLTDTMILFSINPDTKKIVITSFLRDMYVNIPGYGGNRLNSAYVFGGTNLLSETISTNFGMNIDDYVIVNFWLVMDVVDALGGIRTNITAEEIEYMNDYLREHNRLLNKPEGTDYLTKDDIGFCLLNGSQALSYARIRYIGTDFARTSRQREIIFVLLEKIKDMSVKEIDGLLEKFMPSVRTNLSQKDLATLIFMSLGIKDYTIESMTIPIDNTWEYSTINGMSVIEADCEKNGQAWYDIIALPQEAMK